MKKTLCSTIVAWMKRAYLLPFLVFTGVETGAAEAATETAAVEGAGEGDEPAAPQEDAERAAAIARGDVIESPEDKPFSAEFLAEIAGKGESKAEGETTDEKKDKDGFIPKARFNEVNDELKSAKERIAALEAGKGKDADTDARETEQPSEVEQMETRRDELQLKADELLIQGELEERMAILKEIRTLDRQIAKAEMSVEMRKENDQQKVVASLNAVAAKAYELYPFLDVNSETCDTDAVIAVKARRDELMMQGKSPAEALQTAVDEKGPKFAKILGVKEDPGTLTAGQIREQRERQAKEKAAATSLEQPAQLPQKTDKDTFAVDVKALTPEQIKKMPESEKARLRGDVL